MISQLQKHDRHFMQIAFAVASASKCRRAQVGSVIVSAGDHRIISTGRNGKPAGSICDGICFREGLPPNSPKENCCLHSEVNTLLFSNPLDRKGGTMYVTLKPCQDCGLVILNSTIARLVYWDGETEHGHPGWSGEDYWSKYGVPLEVCAYTEESWQRLYGEQGKC